MTERVYDVQVRYHKASPWEAAVWGAGGAEDTRYIATLTITSTRLSAKGNLHTYVAHMTYKRPLAKDRLDMFNQSRLYAEKWIAARNTPARLGEMEFEYIEFR
jgi:hypothetical protein